MFSRPGPDLTEVGQNLPLLASTPVIVRLGRCDSVAPCCDQSHTDSRQLTVCERGQTCATRRPICFPNRVTLKPDSLGNMLICWTDVLVVSEFGQTHPCFQFRVKIKP